MLRDVGSVGEEERERREVWRCWEREGKFGGGVEEVWRRCGGGVEDVCRREVRKWREIERKSRREREEGKRERESERERERESERARGTISSILRVTFTIVDHSNLLLHSRLVDERERVETDTTPLNRERERGKFRRRVSERRDVRER